MSKKSKLIIVVIIFLGGIFIFMCNLKHEQNQIQDFEIQEYKQEILEFSSEKIFGYSRRLGKIINSEIAKENAEKIWIEVYGENIKKNKPYMVYWDDKSNVWLVTGTISKNKLGGVPYIIFSKDDGEIIAVWHTK